MSAATAAPAPSRVETEVRRVRQLLEGSRFAQAETAAQALLKDVPENRDVLYMLAVSQRYQKQVASALATLARLEALHPGYPRLYQERGHCHVARREAAPAMAAFERAVTLNPVLGASWEALRVLYGMAGRRQQAAEAAANVERLAGLPVEIVTAISMFCDGEIASAESLVRQYLVAHGDHVEGMRLLAQIGVKHDVLDDAEVLLENVLRIQPDYHAARYDYATVLLKRHKHVQAREQMERLLRTDPGNRMYRTTYATVCTGFGDYDRALPLYRELAREMPQDPELHLSIGHALKTQGSTGEAIEAYHAAAAARPGCGEAYWSLANLKTYRFTEAELAQMRAEEAAPRIALEDRYHLCFALGKALEDRGEYAESFVWYERGNALKKTECRYRPGITERNTRLQQAICTAEFFAARAGFGAGSHAPIFIVGLPRSGSTLIEQILASHSQVEGTMELADIPRLVQELEGRDTEGGEPRYPAILSQLSADDCRRLGEKYLADTRAYRGGRERFIDKMPNNFRHLGLVHLILPNARIIDARREPMACCFSNFKQLFASGQQFTYSLEDIGRYYRSYVELMRHWEQVLPGRILRVQHEQLVADLGGNVRRILEFCGLPYEAACVEFHRTRRQVHSASSEQVRQPIYKEGVDQWRNFEPWLEPLKTALGDLARR
ncbi:MAG TPA: sulfotransferase [Steroidobacteraceae bacterium]|nr:sulfotransferase [Steroidobacteraceae bacterium]